MKFKPAIPSFKHQRRGLVWLWRKTETSSGLGTKGGGFFWDPGTGKTKAAYDFAAASFYGRGVRRLLVLCPINAIQVWDEQADIHLPEDITFSIHIPEGKIVQKAEYIQGLAGTHPWSELQVLVLNYDAIIKRNKQWEIMKALEAYNPDMVIADESHHIKNGAAKRSKATHRIAGQSRYVLIQTGTPIGKNYLDLYSQLKAIDPSIWKASWSRTGTMSWTDFKQHYAVWGGRTGYELRGYRNLDDLHGRYEPHVRSVRKEDCHDMPAVTDAVIPVDMPASARQAYDIFADDGMVVYKRHLIEAPIPLTKLLRLQQMTGGWVHDEAGELVEVHNAKVQALSGELEDLRAAGRSVVIFARFLREIEAIKETASRHYPWVRSIQGSVGTKQRRQAVTEFQNRPGDGAMVIQVGAAEAIDGLQRVCSDGIFYSTDYSLIHWNQARGRLDRTGQLSPVTFRHIQVRKSVDGLILKALREKKNIERMVVDNPEVLLIAR